MKKVLFPAFDNGFLQLVTEQRSCDLNTVVLLRTDPRERTTFQLRTICAMQKVPDYPACDWKGLLHCKYFEAFHGTTFVCLPMLLWQLSSVHWLLWQRNSDEALLLSGTSQVWAFIPEIINVTDMSTDIQTKINMTNIYLKRMKNKLKNGFAI